MSDQAATWTYRDGNWKVRPCSKKLFSVCEPSSIPQRIDDFDGTNEPCAENWVRHGDYCYGTDLRDQTFLQVVDDSSCPPATITNRFEQALINSLISSKIIPGDSYFWIALQDINKTGEYMWLVDGKEHPVVSFTNWDIQEPGYNGGCVVLSSGINKGRWKVKDCKGFSAKSLCKKPLRAEEKKLNPQEGNMDEACAPSWDTESHLHHCYRVFHHEKLMRKRTWQEAEDLCQDFGAHLASLSNLEEKRFVEELLFTMFKGDRKRQFWIGFNKRNPSSEESWEWSDGSPVVSSFWLDMHSTDDSNNCGTYRAHRGHRRLAALNCNAQLEWICKIPKGVIPKNPDWHIKDVPWVFYQGNNYCFYDLNADFASAEFVCGWMKSGVTSILNRAEQAFIHKRIKQMSKGKQKWWIGLVNEYEGFQRWGDGSSVIFTNWEKDPPRNINRSITEAEKQCAYIESDTGWWSYSDCLSENPAICKTNVMFKIEKHYGPVDNDHDQQPGICPEGWLYYANKCFSIHKPGNMMDGSTASYFCREHSGRLATITNEIEQAFIVLQLYGEKKGFWMGLTKNDYDLWENGTGETYNNWVPTGYTNNSVNPYEQDQLCALISANQSVHQTGKWYLEKCNSKGYGVICEKEQVISNPDIKGSDMFPISETMEYGDKQYRIISGNMSWYDASIVCQNHESKLVSITDPYHQAFVTILAHHLGYPLWIGYYSSKSGDDFKWTDGSMSLFTSWADEESPSDGNCTYIDTNGHWRAEDCDTQLQGALCLPATEPEYHLYDGSCPEGWIRFKYFCYSIHTALTNKPFHQAEELCQEHVSEILRLSGDEEAAFIRYEMKTLTSVQSIWLGRITAGDDGTLAWLGGSKIHYSKWSEETLNADTLIGDYCVSMWIDGTWRIAHCYERRGFICKKLQDSSITCFPEHWNVKRHHFIISIAVASTVVIAIFTWYLLKRKMCFSSPNIQRLQCTQYSPETDEAQLCIPTAGEN
ncbi:secretory phospholipase A2 receptor isoform X2 [Eleutherodactylus coqui]|uniref:secretory phospholipase A2 receptor isoform X2 n=1 Tax=Eleutherodactylus coqui TaxID=57060 RepID=UPI0034627572